MLRSVRPGLVLLSLGAAALAADPAARPPAPVLEHGKLAGARYAVARPSVWNHRLLLLAHGLREESLPLGAELDPGGLVCRTFLDEGWMVATTSYRRNGMIVADAMADLDALRDHIAAVYGTPDRVLVEGDSMGGLIATLIAERGPDHLEGGIRPYQGVVAVDAALGAREPNSSLGLSLQPRIPIVFLTNQSELGGPNAYVTARIPRTDPEARPVILLVARDGHANVNEHERLAALRALNAWLDSGRDALPAPAAGQPSADVTVPPVPQPSQVTPLARGRGFTARITGISDDYGNLSLNAQPADFAAAGIRPMLWFQLRCGGQTFRVRYGRDFFSVKRGEWVAFTNADGFTWVARSYGDAAASAGVRVGDTVTLMPYPPEPAIPAP